MQLCYSPAGQGGKERTLCVEMIRGYSSSLCLVFPKKKKERIRTFAMNYFFSYFRVTISYFLSNYCVQLFFSYISQIVIVTLLLLYFLLSFLSSSSSFLSYDTDCRLEKRGRMSGRHTPKSCNRENNVHHGHEYHHHFS